MRFLKGLFFNLLLLFLISCGHSAGGDEDDKPSKSQEETSGSDSACGIEDGTHLATVNYFNPDTNYSATYSLQVEVEDCEVIQIDFPNGGYLDNDHIDPSEIDEDGNASVEDDQGRSFEVNIDK